MVTVSSWFVHTVDTIPYVSMVCVYVCVCPRSNLPPHTLESDTIGFIAIQEPF